MSEVKQFAIEVVNQLRSGGFIALWAGGCVRDLLMGNTPHDYDVATSATPQQVRELFGMRRTLMVGAAFGVVIVKGSSKLQEQVEVATFRTDSSYTDGRRPDRVTFSTPEKDAQRRDFSINGMFFDPITEEVIDYVGGREDLRAGLIRAIGDPHARLAEDKLRMLRAVRFAARFAFRLDAATESAITTHAAETELVSGERIAIELRKTLETNQAAWAVTKLHDTGLLQVIAPEVDARWTDASASICTLLESSSDDGWLTRVAAMYWPLMNYKLNSDSNNNLNVADCIASLKKRLKLANDEAEAIRFALASQPTLEIASSSQWSEVQRLLVKPHIGTALSLLGARRALKPELSHEYDWLHARLQLPAEQLNPLPLLDGQDLQRAGLSPSAEFRLILQEARDLQLDGKLLDQAAALKWLEVRKRAKTHSETTQ